MNRGNIELDSFIVLNLVECHLEEGLIDLPTGVERVELLENSAAAGSGAVAIVEEDLVAAVEHLSQHVCDGVGIDVSSDVMQMGGLLEEEAQHGEGLVLDEHTEDFLEVAGEGVVDVLGGQELEETVELVALLVEIALLGVGLDEELQNVADVGAQDLGGHQRELEGLVGVLVTLGHLGHVADHEFEGLFVEAGGQAGGLQGEESLSAVLELVDEQCVFLHEVLQTGGGVVQHLLEACVSGVRARTTGCRGC